MRLFNSLEFELFNNLERPLLLILSLFPPVKAESPIIQLGAFFNQIDFSDFITPLRPHSNELVIATSHKAVRLYLNSTYPVDLALVSVPDSLYLHRASSQHQWLELLAFGNLKQALSMAASNHIRTS